MAPVSPVSQGAMEVIRGYNGARAPRALWKTRVRESQPKTKFGGLYASTSLVWKNTHAIKGMDKYIVPK